MGESSGDNSSDWLSSGLVFHGKGDGGDSEPRTGEPSGDNSSVWLSLRTMSEPESEQVSGSSKLPPSPGDPPMSLPPEIEEAEDRLGLIASKHI